MRTPWGGDLSARLGPRGPGKHSPAGMVSIRGRAFGGIPATLARAAVLRSLRSPDAPSAMSLKPSPSLVESGAQSEARRWRTATATPTQIPTVAAAESKIKTKAEPRPPGTHARADAG